MELWAVVSPYFSAVVLIGGCGAVVYKWLAPALNLKKTVEKNTSRIDDIEKREKENQETLNEIKSAQKASNRAMLSVVTHMINGNGVDKLKESQEELMDLLMK